MLRACGLDRNKDCFVTNITHCRPPKNRTPTDQETANCSYILMNELQMVQPDLVFAIGGVAAKFLAGRKVYMTKENGTILHSPRVSTATGKDTLIVPMIHPAAACYKRGTPEAVDIKLAMGEAVRNGLRAIQHPKLKERPA